jgi:UDP-N-acetylmuramoylalanine--D-glutamate ligase
MAKVFKNYKLKNTDLKIYHSSGMEESVKIAHELAKDGDIVSLSPACASFDAYRNFADRGNHFKELVNKL